MFILVSVLFLIAMMDFNYAIILGYLILRRNELVSKLLMKMNKIFYKIIL